MKRMFYKKIKIILLLLISFFMFQQNVFCYETEESILMSNLQYAKNKRQQIKANFKLLQYYMREKEKSQIERLRRI